MVAMPRMTGRARGWAVVGLTGCLVGCSLQTITDGAAATPEAVEARRVVDSLANKDVAAVEARLEESQRTPDPTMQLRLLADLFPAVPPTRVRLVGFDS